MKKILFILSMILMLPVTVCAERVTIDGIHYDVITKGKVAKVVSYEGCKISNLVIPSSITYQGVECSVISIEPSAGNYGGGKRTLKSLVIPGSVKTIGSTAFNGFEYLTSLTISEGVTTIGEDAFHYCTRLSSVTIPNSVTSIEDGAFSECNSLISVSLPNGLKTINGGVFYHCSSLRSVTIPNGVTRIGEYNQEIKGETNVKVIPVSA